MIFRQSLETEPDRLRAQQLLIEFNLQCPWSAEDDALYLRGKVFIDDFLSSSEDEKASETSEFSRSALS